MQLGNTLSEAIHLNQRLQEICEPLTHPFPILGDNTGAIALTKEARFHNSTKCIRLREHLARKLVEQKTITVKSDIMTKSLPRPGFEKLREVMGVVPPDRKSVV